MPYYTSEQIAQAREMDLLTYLRLHDPGELVHVISDAHIYDRHVDIIREMIERPQYPAPKFSLNPEIKDFYEFTTDDIKITDYKKNPQIKDIPIAV